MQAIYCTVIAVVAYFATLIQKKAFSTLGETVTFKIRTLLYGTILQQNIGWFDLKENGTTVLTTVMAEDTAIVNMAAGQSVGPILEGMFSLLGGILIALYN